MTRIAQAALAVIILIPGMAQAMGPSVTASDQSVANGVVSAAEITADANGWLVVHRTDADMKPGPVVAHAPVRAGMTTDVAAILTEDVAPGDMLMLMVHGEDGGTRTGIFEYTLGATEDGPVRMDGNLVMTVITAR
jgi:hypothetical protein